MTVHVCHILWSFRTGGLENGVVNLINQLKPDEFRHSIICLTDYDPAYSQRITQQNVQIYCLHKRPGHDLSSFWRCFRLIRRLKPDICHSRNLAAMEYQLPAMLARVPLRIHGEHGWDLTDLGGQNKKYVLLKRLFKAMIHRYVSLSREGLNYLQHSVGVSANRIALICNGVDTERFQPASRANSTLPKTLTATDRLIFGSVGRIADVKNQQLLVAAYIALCQEDAAFQRNTALVIIGDGPARPKLQQQLTMAGLAEQSWLPGDRNDIAIILPGLSVFVLPSLAEGISNTILEAMACGLPVIASNVGGNPELVSTAQKNSEQGQTAQTGWIFSSNNKSQLQQLMLQCQQAPAKLQILGDNARAAAVQKFSLDTMISAYRCLYLDNNKQQEG
ncbi:MULTISPECIES: TIGR03088 family PEP-CTERM/XrtA system glycosyltransferase [unclassified Arsukibacterium]|uniref:TIGR03088 family PEP-CTERM/XrtA system glycosyltransferase n=1 Tax=unclassified Arsukibacterium TaxID=2635278 RepID=UPI000C93AB40|nr:MULTISPECIES: TIGR03088 family PEP-CTERM/XrtA system glycosyltransferase [unclassified Arsukibacterium]MAA95343.1 sugar transferase [Rheinheimera sp.]|tara:strand:- start:52098 stop:53270 length:1173 start_codon:yes stop_codon:yes gene_type:complete